MNDKVKVLVLKDFNQLKKGQEVEVSQPMSRVLAIRGLATYNTEQLTKKDYSNKMLVSGEASKKVIEEKQEQKQETKQRKKRRTKSEMQK